jgi:hypothetical protein
MDAKTLLSNTIQGTIHQSVPQNFQKMPTGFGDSHLTTVRLTLHRATFYGSGQSEDVAQTRAAQAALAAVQQAATEFQVRELLQLDPRIHLAEMDSVRVQLQHLKTRMRHVLAGGQLKTVKRELGRLHMAVDDCERAITTVAGVSD